MIKTVKQAQTLTTAFNKLKTDDARLNYIIKHPEKLMLQLDNDYTHISFVQPDDTDFTSIEGCELNKFDECFGDQPGVYLLFSKLGIRAESV